jgi:hypothetical protein
VQGACGLWGGACSVDLLSIIVFSEILRSPAAYRAYSTELPHFRVFRGTACILFAGWIFEFCQRAYSIYVTSGVRGVGLLLAVVQAVQLIDENVKDPRFPILQLLFRCGYVR